MSYRLDTHALIVDANAIHKVDIGNLANLYSMWIGKFIFYASSSHTLTSQSSLDAQTLLNRDED
jgi:hypothetical protein